MKIRRHLFQEALFRDTFRRGICFPAFAVGAAEEQAGAVGAYYGHRIGVFAGPSPLRPMVLRIYRSGDRKPLLPRGVSPPNDTFSEFDMMKMLSVTQAVHELAIRALSVVSRGIYEYFLAEHRRLHVAARCQDFVNIDCARLYVVAIGIA